MDAIKLINITFSYNRQLILNNISLTIKTGSYVGLIGPNGGGKTTLLKIILGLIKPQKGEVKIFGDAPIGYVSQRISQENLNFPATVQEIVESGQTIKKNYNQSLVDQVLKTSNVYHLKKHLISKLSGGERQRVYVARALVAEPKILILDEPFTGIDIGSQEDFYEILKNLNEKMGITILFVSHDIDVISDHAKEIICLNHRLVCQGKPKDIMEKNIIEELYGKKIIHIHHE